MNQEVGWGNGPVGKGVFAEPDNLSSIHRAHMWEDRTDSLKLYHDRHMNATGCIYTHMHNMIYKI